MGGSFRAKQKFNPTPLTRDVQLDFDAILMVGYARVEEAKTYEKHNGTLPDLKGQAKLSKRRDCDNKEVSGGGEI